MLPNWYEATVLFVLMAGAALVLTILVSVGMVVWFKLSPPKRSRVSSYPGPR